MQQYRVLDHTIAAVDPEFVDMLARAHASHSPAHCLCRSDREMPLYVTKRQSGFVLARWPGSGARHHVSCDHYDAPDDLTGLGQVQGNAVKNDSETGDVHLKLAFPLKRGTARSAPSAITNDTPALKHNGRKLSMRGLLHILWNKAELTHWYPRMGGKRSWFIVRRELLAAAENCFAKGAALGPRLFVPETFRLDDRTGLTARRHATLTPARLSPDTMMIVIGEMKTIGESRYGEAIGLRHLPDWPMYMDTDTAKRFHRRFAVEQDLWRSSAEDDGHLILAASFSLRQSGAAEMFDIALMPVTREWLPYENPAERELVRVAVAGRRSFVKGLRVDLEPSRPIANITLTDTAPKATAIHLVGDNEGEAEETARQAFLATIGVDHYSWQPGVDLPEPKAIERRIANGDTRYVDDTARDDARGTL